MLLENLSFLILSPDLESRTKLREVLKAFVYKGTIKYDRTLRGMAARFAGKQEDKFDAVFIAANFGRETIVNFMQEVRRTEGAKLPPVIIFINSKELERSSEVAALYLEGISGFISEPYSSEELLRLIDALRNNQGDLVDQKVKIRKAAEFLAHDAMSHIDEIAKQQMQGDEPGGYALKDLRSVSKSLAQLVQQDLELYSEVLSSAFQKAKPASEADLQRKSRRAQKKVTHPGAVIRDMMRARGLSAERLLPLLHMDPAEFDQLLKEQRPVTEVMAKELSRTLGMTPYEWMKLQRDFDSKQKAAR